MLFYNIFLYFVLYESFSTLHYSFALLAPHVALRAHTLCSNLFMCFNNSLEIPLGYELKVLLQSQFISYYMLYRYIQ